MINPESVSLDVNIFDQLEALDDCVGDRALPLFNELNDIQRLYESDVVSRIVPHIIALFECLNSKCQEIRDLNATTDYLKNENVELSKMYNNEKNKYINLLHDAERMDREAELISREDIHLKNNFQNNNKDVGQLSLPLYSIATSNRFNVLNELNDRCDLPEQVNDVVININTEEDTVFHCGHQGMRHSKCNCKMNNALSCKATLCKLRKVTNVDYSKKKVSIVSDSHGRHIRETLTELLGNDYFVDSYIKPGATLDVVLQDVRSVTKNYNKNDFLIIFGGNNDIGSESQSQIVELTKRITSELTHVNVLHTTLFYRYDKPELNNCIFEINKDVCRVVDGSLAQIIDVNKFLSRDLFTRHGLHLLRKGKKRICQQMAFCIKNHCTKRSVNICLTNEISPQSEQSHLKTSQHAPENFSNNINDHVVDSFSSHSHSVVSSLADSLLINDVNEECSSSKVLQNDSINSLDGSAFLGFALDQ